MKKTFILPALLPLSIMVGACTPPQTEPDTTAVLAPELKLTISNPANGSALAQVTDVPYSSNFAPGLAFTKGKTEALILDKDGDGKSDHVRILAQADPGGQDAVTLELVSQLSDKAHAELSVRQDGQWQETAYQADGFRFEAVDSFTSPPQLTDHSYYLRYEGPGWESDVMAYRLYLDWRNGIDIFGKKLADVVLPAVGQDGYDSYHEMGDWGMDLLKVGKSLGLGALGRLDDGQVVKMQQVANTHWQLLEDGPLSSRFSVTYEGWDVAGQSADVSTEYRINAGDGATRIDVKSSTALDNLVTGLVRHPGVTYLSGKGQQWGYIATYGKQSLASDDDELGMAVFYPISQVKQESDDEFSYLLQFTSGDQFSYYIVAYWPQQPDTAPGEDAFKQYLTSRLAALEAPFSVTVK